MTPRRGVSPTYMTLTTGSPYVAKEQYTLDCCNVAAAALLLYEYTITLGRESRLIWTDVRTGYAAIFLINRLNMLCMVISLILRICPWLNAYAAHVGRHIDASRLRCRQSQHTIRYDYCDAGSGTNCNKHHWNGEDERLFSKRWHVNDVWYRCQRLNTNCR
ncbi:hypothetical protein DAEQUDRAFT_175350 [Daedalea quercina L-15889]|uniref:DUF6533 domain-containing protein n=1 Tax=Daedalea quercina L-15889 TaxID=1314783 RepID=A0A165RCL1_9APHY|nr:hypothetical protein DAEQUDRAFT_175350 [Daedalea quercina L-15889]